MVKYIQLTKKKKKKNMKNNSIEKKQQRDTKSNLNDSVKDPIITSPKSAGS